MNIPSDIKVKLIKLLEESPIEESKKTAWVQALKQDSVSPGVLYGICKTLDDVGDLDQEFSNNKEGIKAFFDKQEKRLSDSGKDVESEISGLKNRTEDLKKEVQALKDEYDVKNSPETKHQPTKPTINQNSPNYY